LLPEIININEQEEPKKGILKPCVFSAVIICLLGSFISKTISTSNLRLMNGWALALPATYFVVFSVIIAFWLSVNLVTTLWILFTLFLPVLFFIDRAITPQQCAVDNSKQNNKKKYS